jgi:hypothetical protein
MRPEELLERWGMGQFSHAAALGVSERTFRGDVTLSRAVPISARWHLVAQIASGSAE